jgi:hypothetical protein
MTAIEAGLAADNNAAATHPITDIKSRKLLNVVR